MYAIIKTGGKQYKVAVGDDIYVEKLEGEAGDEVKFTELVGAFGDDGAQFGDALKDLAVTGEIVKQGKQKKVIVFKYKAKKGYRRKNGHRQAYTKVNIKAIG